MLAKSINFLEIIYHANRKVAIFFSIENSKKFSNQTLVHYYNKL